MGQTIKRGTGGVRRQAAAAGKARKVERARKHTGGLMAQALDALPVAPETVQRVAIVAILGAAALGAVHLARVAGAFTLLQSRFEMAAADAGFAVKRVEVRGLARMNELKVYEEVLGERDRAMPGVDITALRTRLKKLSWVKDARVSRQLPDTLVVDVIERNPHAVLRRPDGSLALVDETGHELEPATSARARAMLVVSGEQAGPQVPVLDALLEAAPALRPQVAEAQWVGNRRWNLTFAGGQTLALPEGEKDAARALVDFARMDGVDRLLGGKVAVFDMRAPDRMFLRVPGHSEEEAAAGRKAWLAKLAKANAKTDARAAEKPAAKPAAKPATKPAKKKD